LLSYRHAFHAGNHADVLKHLVLVSVLDYLTRKPKPLWYVDTHAGAGVYALDRGFAAQRGEYCDGIGRLWDRSDLGTAPAAYLTLVRELNGDGPLRRYPGSPWLAQRLLRRDDRLWLHELHPADHALLTRTVVGRAVRIEQGDGFDALRRLLPPQPRRALVLIDPPYEVKSDYDRAVTALEDGLTRFATGTYILWYPMLSSPPAQALPARLASLGEGCDWLHVQLRVRAPGPGLYGSGLFVLNPPYTLPALLAECLASLAALLDQGGGGFELDSRIA
jgi:23S rRNA (adenine2030-N6)-methyltransferase